MQSIQTISGTAFVHCIIHMDLQKVRHSKEIFMDFKECIRKSCSYYLLKPSGVFVALGIPLIIIIMMITIILVIINIPANSNYEARAVLAPPLSLELIRSHWDQHHFFVFPQRDILNSMTIYQAIDELMMSLPV